MAIDRDAADVFPEKKKIETLLTAWPRLRPVQSFCIDALAALSVPSRATHVVSRHVQRVEETCISLLQGQRKMRTCLSRSRPHGRYKSCVHIKMELCHEPTTKSSTLDGGLVKARTRMQSLMVVA
ncbi:hypothetical protein SEVIR_1G189802v4 [Setaria viridis]